MGSVERVIIKAIENQLAIYAIHTNLDNVANGVNAKICEKIGLKNCRILSPKDEKNKLVGAGMIGQLNKSIGEKAFLTMLKKKLQTECIRYTRLFGGSIRKVAVCGGSGSFLLDDAINQGADILVTADFKYHQFFDAEDKIIIADIGHYESEQFTMELLYQTLKKKFRNFALQITNINTNPINYF